MSINSTDAVSTMMASGVVGAFILNSLASTICICVVLAGLIFGTVTLFYGPDPFGTDGKDKQQKSDDTLEGLFGCPVAIGIFGCMEAVFLASNTRILRLLVKDSPTLQNTGFGEWWLYFMKGQAILVAMFFGLLMIYPVGKLLTRPWRKTECAVCAAREAKGQTETLPGHETCAADEADGGTESLPSHEAPVCAVREAEGKDETLPSYEV